MSDTEIEIQVRVDAIDKLKQFLDAEAEHKGEKYQKDEYFTPEHRDFTATEPIAEWLRLRESKNNSITYKNWHYDKKGKSNYCDEYEAMIDNASQLRKIFAAVNMRPVITVEKKRNSWRYKDFEVSIDDVTDLGNFVEVEYKGPDSNQNPEDIIKQMVQFLKQAGCSKIERNFMGYPYMILYPEQVRFEEV